MSLVGIQNYSLQLKAALRVLDGERFRIEFTTETTEHKGGSDETTHYLRQLKNFAGQSYSILSED
jgi:hypothetical protein